MICKPLFSFRTHPVTVRFEDWGGIDPPPPPPTPPCTKSATAADRNTPLHEFFLSRSYTSFDTKFAKIGPSVVRSHDVLYSHVGTKSAFCICLCTKHMEITDFLKCTKTVLFCLFGHLHNFLYLEINQDQITKIKNHKNNEIHKKYKQ